MTRQKRLLVAMKLNNNRLVSALWGQPHSSDTETNTHIHCSHYANAPLSTCMLRVEGQNAHFLCVEKVKTFWRIEDIVAPP